ncbi:MAG: carboxypeptidase regulatory-like domain-containing protein [Candidatus Kapaibacterium sp.]|jgi:hypothetical protein
MNRTRSHAIRYYLPLLAVLVLIVGACRTNPTGPTPTNDQVVSGTLHDEQGYVIPNSIVEAVDAANKQIAIDTTDESGAFSLAKLPSDLTGIDLRVTNSDFKAMSASLKMFTQHAGGKTGLLIPLEHQDSCCGKLGMTVTAGGSPLGGVSVRLNRNDHLVSIVTTDSTGYVNFEHLCAGNYGLRFSKDGFHVVERSVTIGHCDTTGLDIRMEAGANTGDSCCHTRVVINPRDSSNGTIILGAMVSITKANTSFGSHMSTGAGAVFEGLCPGVYNVNITSDHFAHIEFSFTLTCAQSLEINRGMLASGGGHNSDSCCHGLIVVNVLDSATTNGLSGATVHLFHGSTLLGTSISNDHGVAQFAGLCPGDYSVSLNREHYTEQGFTTSLTCNDTVRFSRTLAPVSTSGGGGHDSCCNAGMVLTIRDADHHDTRLGNVTVTITKDNQIITSGTTNADGGFTADGLCGHATYHVTFTRDGYHLADTNFTYTDCTTIHENIDLHHN